MLWGRRGEGQTGDPDLHVCRLAGFLPPMQTSFKSTAVGPHSVHTWSRHFDQACGDQAQGNSWWEGNRRAELLMAHSHIQTVSLTPTNETCKYVIHILASDCATANAFVTQIVRHHLNRDACFRHLCLYKLMPVMVVLCSR